MQLSSASTLDHLLQTPQYSLPQPEKSGLLVEELLALTLSHRSRCEPYRNIVEGMRGGAGETDNALEAVPFLPARLFKTLQLQSIPDERVLKVLTSSGTTLQKVSRVVIDKETSMLQTQALAAIITSFIGPKRLPMIMIDSASVLKDRSAMNARGAGLVGLSNFGRDHFYALDSEMRLDVNGLKAFVERHAGSPVLLFGFTFMVWRYFYQELKRSGEKLNLERGILIHSGGWKKLEDEAVSNEQFKSALQEQTGIARIHNFYGMVEQVGGIYMECEHGFFHAPNMADVLVRSPRDWSVLPAGQTGLIQTMSALTRSYPGHSLLTEDLGTICGADDCRCGRKGVRFKVHGRMARAELRGCSDTHAFSRAVPTQAGAIRRFLPEPGAADDVTGVCGASFFRQQPIRPFHSVSLEFLDHLSTAIFKEPSAKEYPELIALAFWLRTANVRGVVGDFETTLSAGELAQPVGVAFHVAPSNVDTIFLYSWALSLLAGNLNVVRISQTVTPQLELLLGLVERVIRNPRFEPLRERNVVLTYPHDEKINAYFSQHADARIVWGGDETVSRLRALPAKATTREISFANKVSACVVNAARYLEMPDDIRTASMKAFYNDAYQFDQMACSSPHFVVFGGAEQSCAAASERFWNALAREVERRQDLQPSASVDRLVGACELLGRGVNATWTHGQRSTGPAVVRVPLDSLGSARERLGGGFFVESFIADLSALAEAVQSDDQTLTYIGYTREEMHEAARALSVKGIDRIVPAGQALNFTPVWDGYVLLGELTRRVVVT